MQLSAHFSLEEMIVSQAAARRGLSNDPPPDVIENLKVLCAALELARAHLGHPIVISSGYRSANVNAIVGGVPTSAHIVGFAADILCPNFGNALSVCRALSTSEIPFDQIIFEYAAWCHFSVAPAMRREKLTKFYGENHYHIGFVATP